MGTEVAWPAKPRMPLRPVAEEAPAANSRAPAFGFLPSDEEEANEPDIWNSQTCSIEPLLPLLPEATRKLHRMLLCQLKNHTRPGKGNAATPTSQIRRPRRRKVTQGHAARVRWRWGLVPGQMLCLSGAGLPICKIKTNFEDAAENRDLLNK